EKLENFIPLIRFLHISSGDFYKKVKPFARILPIELYEDLLQYYLVPNHQPSLELMQPKRMNGSSELYGGYTPIDWLSQNTWGYCKESFIFCLDDKDLDKSIISRVKDPSRAINYYNNYGPSFGTGDLKMTGNFKNESRCCCQHGDYELPIRANSDDIHFSVDEYEVFQIIPRRRRKRNMD
ncbi:10063_t:CDS:2, partial [Entrophospora sp. SA101]